MPDTQTTATGPADKSLTGEERVRLQQALTDLGFDAGPADGDFGSRTRAAIWGWQEANGHEATGYVTRGQAAYLAAVDASQNQEQEPSQGAADHLSGDVLVFGPATGPKCAGMREGAKCWLELANQPGCCVFDSHYVPSQTALWSGTCTDGIAVGQGTLEYGWPGNPTIELTGTLVWGKLDGHWILRMFNGTVAEGSFVGNEQQGRWVVREADGDVGEGPYVDGKRQGQWVFRRSDGRVKGEANFVNGTGTP